MKRVSFYLVIFEIFLFVVFNGCSDKRNNTLTGSGTLEATEILISSKTIGTVMDLLVKEGDNVVANQLIALVDTQKIYLQKKQLLAGLNELQLNLENASRAIDLAGDNFENIEKKYNRIKTLFEAKSVTQQDLDDVETAYKAAKIQYETVSTNLKVLRSKRAQLKTQLELIDSQLQDAQITSPTQGTIIEKYIEQGEIARTGGPVVTIADLKKIWIKIYFKENELGKIKLNANADIRISSFPDRSFPGRISWISPKAEFTPKMVQTKEARSDLVYAVKIEIENQEGILKIGMPADVELK